jgi:UDP-glucose 4-epimerase
LNILVTGGAGYIGSHFVKQLGELGEEHNITIIDNLSTGFRENILYGDFIEADLNNFAEIEGIFKAKSFDTIVHFAASIVVSESTQDPMKYYMNNTVNTINLINLSLKYNVKKFIFSSTAAVYGQPDSAVVREESKLNPINPYGFSKLMSERALIDSAKSSEMKYVIFRYFNVAGADEELRIGQCSKDATHLVKISAESAIRKRDKMYIYGDDYETEDGTCIRDYIHVDDLVSAHIQALDYLDNNDSEIFNCGYGKGYSVLQVVDTMKKLCGIDFRAEIAPRRDGDPKELVANNKKILKKLKWKPKYDDLEFICKTALYWERKLQSKITI